eukprot:14211715-Alexandrium_andersonii.AAC.1
MRAPAQVHMRARARVHARARARPCARAGTRMHESTNAPWMRHGPMRKGRRSSIAARHARRGGGQNQI